MESATSMTSEMAESISPCIAECDVFKDTASSELVIKRHLRLFHDHFYTYHDFAKDGEKNRKKWILDKHCTLQPKVASEIVAKKKYVRLPGTWTISATVGLASTSEISVFGFSLVWPTSWRASGYSTFLFGFDSADHAQHWHKLITTRLEVLQGAAPSSGGKLSTVSVNSVTSTLASVTDKVTDKVASALEGATDQAKALIKNKGTSGSGVPPAPGVVEATAAPAAEVAAEPEHDFHDAIEPEHIHVDSEDEDAATTCDPVLRVLGAVAAQQQQQAAASASALGRWVPYKQTNGVAIYFQGQQDDEKEDVGGEFMVSAVVRGSPQDCLAALSSGNYTSVLGPASAIEVLKPYSSTDPEEVVRITLDAPGWAGFLCAPRQAIVRTHASLRENRTIHLSFVSVPPPDPSTPAIVAMALERRHLWKRPVPCWVRGAYQISPIKGRSVTNSPDSLVTCMIKCDINGWCGSRAPLRPVADIFGWPEAFLDRILMSVQLVRDAVEHKNFVQTPFQIAEVVAQAPEAVEAAQETDADGLKPTSSTAKMLQRSMVIREHSMSGVASLGSEGELAAKPDTIAEGVEVALDYEAPKKLCTLDVKYWGTFIHRPGAPQAFSVRGPTYLKDRKKVPGGTTMLQLVAVDMVELTTFTQHLARFLPSVRKSPLPFTIVVNVAVPGNPLLGLVLSFGADVHPDVLKDPPADPMEDRGNWSPFDFVLYKFLNGNDDVRNRMLKMIPHVAEGSWMIKSSVGTTPVILGKALKTTYHRTKKYLEIDVDISANSVANYTTGLARGCAKSLVVDLGFVLEGTTPWELPEVLLGCVRLSNLDCSKGAKIDMTQEIPLE